jgi:hypothetical protein
MAGDKIAWKEFGRTYKETVECMHARGLFVGKTQNVLAAMHLYGRI